MNDVDKGDLESLCVILQRCTDNRPIIGIGRLSFTQLVSTSFYFYYRK